MTGDTTWIIRIGPTPRPARITLFCAAYAGGSPNMFRSWAGGLASDVELIALQPPGHGVRRHEPIHHDWSAIVDDAFCALSSHLSSPHAFYGHSFGARLAYEFTHRAMDEFPGLTKRLIVSGCRAPNWPQLRPLMHTLPDELFRDALASMGGTPQEVLDDARLMRMILPVARGEIRLAEQWGDRHGVGVSVPITAIYGRDDPTDNRAAAAAWRGFGTEVEVVEMPGGHFFLDTHREALVAFIDARLRGTDGHDSRG